MLGTYRGVDVAKDIALVSQQLHRLFQNDLTIHVQRRVAGVGEVIADVAQVGSTEQRVADGVDEHVGVAVSQQSFAMFDLDAAEPEVAAFDELVDIVAHAHTRYIVALHFVEMLL